jgi:hypothetical protein
MFHLKIRQVALFENSARTQIVIILINLSESIANFQMLFVVVHPVFLTAVNG